VEQGASNEARTPRPRDGREDVPCEAAVDGGRRSGGVQRERECVCVSVEEVSEVDRSTSVVRNHSELANLTVMPRWKSNGLGSG